MGQRRLAETAESRLCDVCLRVYDWPLGLHFIDGADVCCLAAHRRAFILEIGCAVGSLRHDVPLPFYHVVDDSFTKRHFDMMRGYGHD